MHDVIVIGLGATGSATCLRLARAGASVLGIDRWTPPHAFGSTHGDTRITRLAIGEGERYVPLVKRSHELWRSIEAETGEELLVQCGGLMMAEPQAGPLHGVDSFLGTTIEAARAHGVEHELLSGDEARARCPQLAVGADVRAYYEPTAGFVRPERAVAAQLRLAREAGATLALDTPVRAIDLSGTTPRVRTDRGTHEAARVVVAAGPWVGELLPSVDPLFTVHRQVQFWFDLEDADAYATWRGSPIFIWELGRGDADFVYGFPAIDGPGGGVKVASEDYATTTTPDACAREVGEDEVRAMYERYVEGRLHGVTDRCLRAATCLYTVTRDVGFVVDVLPESEDVIVASPCSGHGFKHSAALGEAIAQMVGGERPDVDLAGFGLARLG